MLYELEMGLFERNIARQSIQAGQPIPERIQNKPNLQIGLELYLDAFFDLDTERDNSFGAGMIKWSSIKEYAHYYKFNEEQTDKLFFFIRKMDVVRLKNFEQKKPKK